MYWILNAINHGKKANSKYMRSLENSYWYVYLQRLGASTPHEKYSDSSANQLLPLTEVYYCMHTM